MIKRKICPLTLIKDPLHPIGCAEEKCAWWHNGHCIVLERIGDEKEQ